MRGPDALGSLFPVDDIGGEHAASGLFVSHDVLAFVLHIDGILQAPGTYTAGNLPAHITGTGSLVVTDGTVVLTPAEIWRDQHFSTIANTGDAADDADPDDDGYANLLERAFGLNPLGHDATGRPVIAPAGSDIAFTFQHARDATDLELTVELSPDLAPSSWRGAILSPAANADGSLELLDDTRPDVQVHRFTATAGAERGFFRIRVIPRP